MRVNKIAILFGIILSLQVACANTNKLSDVEYNFDKDKVSHNKDSFHFLRTFVDYYYLLIAKNAKNLNITKIAGSFSGWCAGDAHPENLGLLLQKNRSVLFTLNDMDDSGPCPVAYDLFRLLVSSRLFMPSINSEKIINSYIDGLQGKIIPIPSTIVSMKKNSIQDGFEISEKLLQGKSFKRFSSMSEVDILTKHKIALLLEEKFSSENLKVLDIVATKKLSGGSAGLQRYEVLITNNTQQLIHLEFKELVTPAIATVATEPIPMQNMRMKKTLEINQGTGFSHYYDVLDINGKTMLLLPKFKGNRGVKLENQNDNDNFEIIKYEAYIMAGLHAKSVNSITYNRALKTISGLQWEEDIQGMTDLFIERFAQLKNE